MLENRRGATYEYQFPSSAVLDTARPMSKGPAIATYPDGGRNQGLVMEELGIDDMRAPLFELPIFGDTFGGRKIVDYTGQLVSWSLHLRANIDEESLGIFKRIITRVSDPVRRGGIKQAVEASIPLLYLTSDEGIYLEHLGKRFQIADDGILLPEPDGLEHPAESVVMPGHEFFTHKAAVLFPESEVEICVYYNATTDELLTDAHEALEGLGFDTMEDRQRIELAFRESIINPGIHISFTG